MTRSDRTFVVCGGGLAGLIVTLSLANTLGDNHKIVHLDDVGSTSADLLYGSVTAPSGYDFYRSLGLDEPSLFLRSATSFSFGTHYKKWPSPKSNWLQCHHQPLPNWFGVPLQHHLTQQKLALESVLVSAQAARHGKFAHPPEDPAIALSRAEYGYQFDVEEWVSLLRAAVSESRVELVSGEIANIERQADRIVGVQMRSGANVSGDLYIDCTGPERSLLSAVDCAFIGDRKLSASLSVAPAERLGPPCRLVEATEHGWISTTHLQSATHTLTVVHSDQANTAEATPVVRFGQVDKAWIGNCVGIGHAASVLEPVTPAPMMMVQRDVERLLELIPTGKDMLTERREYNRRFSEDVAHVEMFRETLFQLEDLPAEPYWAQARTHPMSAALHRKIAQFENRGLLVKYDLEPFNDEDWTILYNGMGRTPRHYSRQVERVAAADLQREFAGLKQGVDQIVARMPEHHTYVANMKRYLMKQKHV